MSKANKSPPPFEAGVRKNGWRGLRLAVLICGVLAGAGSATAAGECPLIIGVASTPGRPDLFKSFIGGEWRTSASGKTLKVLSPCNETVLYEVQVPVAPLVYARAASPRVGAVLFGAARPASAPAVRMGAFAPACAALTTTRPRPCAQACTQGEIDEAFAAAKKAQKLWSKTPLYGRVCCVAPCTRPVPAVLVTCIHVYALQRAHCRGRVRTCRANSPAGSVWGPVRARAPRQTSCACAQRKPPCRR